MFKHWIKTTAFAITTALSALTLSGCSSGFNPDTFEVTLNTEYSPGFVSGRMETILSIRSLIADPISVTAVNVNGGSCTYSQRYGKPVGLPAHFQMGQVLTLYLKCPYDFVVKVDVETDQGNASYSFK